MFGLGWMELLIIAGVISLFAGPTALRKVLQAVQEVNQVKSDFTGPGALKRLLGADLGEDERAGGERPIDEFIETPGEINVDPDEP